MVKGYIITSGPHGGKTALIDELSERGYNIVHESARDIIAEQSNLEEGILPWTNLTGFQTLVIDEQRKREDEYKNQEFFADRGIFDNYAYFKEGDLEVPEVIEHILNFNKQRYEKVFILDPVPGYKTDAQRVESPERAVKIQQLIKEAYMRYGQEIIEVPLFEGKTKEESIRKRADFVLENIL